MKPVGIGLIGIGQFAGAIARDIDKTETTNFINCFTRTKEKREAFAEKWKCKPVESYEEMLKDPELEAVTITSPNQVHAEQGIQAAEAGKHVFVEKPITQDPKTAIDLIKACEKAKVVLQVGHNDRRFGPNQAVKKRIEAGELGKPIIATANHSGHGFANYPKGDWRRNPDYVFGPMAQLGIHKVDTFRYLFGDVEKVAAADGKFTYLDEEVNDSCGAMLHFKSGTIGFIGSTYTGWGAFLTVQGTKAVIRSIGGWSDEWPNDYREGKRIPIWKIIQDGKQDSGWKRIPWMDQAMKESQMTEFARCIRKKQKPMVDGVEGLKTLATTFAIKRAADEKRWVEVKEILDEAGWKG